MMLMGLPAELALQIATLKIMREDLPQFSKIVVTIKNTWERIMSSITVLQPTHLLAMLQVTITSRMLNSPSNPHTNSTTPTSRQTFAAPPPNCLP